MTVDAEARQQIGALGGMTVRELREKWREVFGEGEDGDRNCTHIGQRGLSASVASTQTFLFAHHPAFSFLGAGAAPTAAR